MALAAGAAIGRTRWQDLGGAAAAPCAFAVLGLLGAAPLRLLPTQFADMNTAQHHAWALAWHEWALTGVLAVALACWSSRDSWYRLPAVLPR